MTVLPPRLPFSMPCVLLQLVRPIAERFHMVWSFFSRPSHFSWNQVTQCHMFKAEIVKCHDQIGWPMRHWVYYLWNVTLSHLLSIEMQRSREKKYQTMWKTFSDGADELEKNTENREREAWGQIESLETNLTLLREFRNELNPFVRVQGRICLFCL